MVSLAWHNIFQRKKRTLAAVAGIAASILLVFMQLGFLQGAKLAAISLFQCFDYDLVIVSDKYQFIDAPGRFDRIRLSQARAIAGVESVMGLSLWRGTWEDPDTELSSGVILIGIPMEPQFIRDVQIRQGLSSLERKGSLLVDLYSHENYGDLSRGREVEVNGLTSTISGQFKLGVRLISDGCIIVSDQTYARLTRGDAREISYGFLRVKPGTDPREVKEQLAAILPNDVRVLERKELNRREQHYFITVKPVGIMFQTGVLVAFVAGLVILFEVLSRDISNKAHEFATLKAMGFSDWYVYGIGIHQAGLYGFMSFIPSLFLAFWVYHLVHLISRLPMHLTFPLGLSVLAMTLIMCSISSILSLQKVKRTDPVELF